MSELREHILAFAGSHESFAISELSSCLPESLLHSHSTLEWYLSQLTKEGVLVRRGRGIYTSKTLPTFALSEEETDKTLFDSLKNSFPDASFCVYNGGVFSSIQHHLAYNALTYVETQRELTEVVFHILQEKGLKVFHRPNKKVFHDYIDIAYPAVIVKPLISGSPLRQCCSVTVPMLEKILVDIRRDDDFSYMSGGEAYRMLENAVSLYTINKTKLLRYAGRRNCLAEFETDLKKLGL